MLLVSLGIRSVGYCTPLATSVSSIPLLRKSHPGGQWRILQIWSIICIVKNELNLP